MSTTEWGVRYSNGRIVENTEEGAREAVEELARFGLDAQVVARVVPDWQVVR